jgi:glycosyltransferase involved in cell wall biosynthesis
LITFPKISIVTPSYNQGHFIEQTILSVIGQGYPNLEYIIIDGGSTDNTVDIIKKYSDKITYWVSEPDNGQSDALNKGLQKCTGEIFNWINSDDYLEKSALFKIAQYFTDNEACELLCGYCSYFDSETLRQTFIHRLALFDTVEDTLIQQKINQPASFYKLSILKELGAINNDLHFCMDLDLWFRYLVQFGQENILFVDDKFAHFRLHNESKTFQLQVKFRDEEKLVWYHLLSTLEVSNSVTSFFAVDKSYSKNIEWQCNKITKRHMVTKICKKYFFDFYREKNFEASKFAFWNQLNNGKLRFEKPYFGIFYNLYFKSK